MNVLIVDDSKAMRCIIARALREMGVPGTPYLEAENGKVALRTIAEAKPELVISDLNMPEVSGMELLRTLRNDGNAIPFGFITSEASAQLKEEAAQAGAQFVITKPFTPANLSQAMGGVLAELGCSARSLDAEAPPVGMETTGKFPTAVQMAGAFNSLLRKHVSPLPGNAPPLPVVGSIVAEYWVEGGPLEGCAICDVAFASRTAAALSLIPAGVAEEAIRARTLEDVLAENFHEVLNVMARFFDHGGSSRIHLGAVHLPKEKLAPELSAKLAKPAARLNVAVDIAGYGKGVISLLSLTA